jgi:aldehyde dehydrogenase (NAD+)
MGKIVAQTVAGRLGRSLLELGGNNAIIVTPDADIKMTVIGAVELWNCRTKMYFNTSFELKSIYDKVKDAVVAAYKQLHRKSIRRKQSRWTANRYGCSRNAC